MRALTLNYKGVDRTAVYVRPNGESILCYQVTPEEGFRSFTKSEIRNLDATPVTDEIRNSIPERLRKDLEAC